MSSFSFSYSFHSILVVLSDRLPFKAYTAKEDSYQAFEVGSRKSWNATAGKETQHRETAVAGEDNLQINRVHVSVNGLKTL
jgi:hypothetical protein